jgi:hypothetical protein
MRKRAFCGESERRARSQAIPTRGSPTLNTKATATVIVSAEKLKAAQAAVLQLFDLIVTGGRRLRRSGWRKSCTSQPKDYSADHAEMAQLVLAAYCSRQRH